MLKKFDSSVSTAVGGSKRISVRSQETYACEINFTCQGKQIVDVQFSKFPSQPPTGVTRRCEDHRCIWKDAVPQYLRRAKHRGATRSEINLRRSVVTGRERRGPLFALVSLDVRVPGSRQFHASRNRTSPPGSSCVISRLAGGDPLPAFDEAVEKRSSAGVVSTFPIRCRSRADLAAPCTASITVPLENRYRLDLTITYRDHQAFAKTKFQDRCISLVPGRDDLN